MDDLGKKLIVAGKGHVVGQTPFMSANASLSSNVMFKRVAVAAWHGISCKWRF